MNNQPIKLAHTYKKAKNNALSRHVSYSVIGENHKRGREGPPVPKCVHGNSHWHFNIGTVYPIKKYLFFAHNLSSCQSPNRSRGLVSGPQLLKLAPRLTLLSMLARLLALASLSRIRTWPNQRSRSPARRKQDSSRVSSDKIVCICSTCRGVSIQEMWAGLYLKWCPTLVLCVISTG